MCSWVRRTASACWGPVRRHARMSKVEDDDDDALLWSRDTGRHSVGDFSFAVVQANENLEDHSQVETGPAATFVGVYDGHGGSDASKFIRDHLFAHLMRLARESGTISEDVVKNAFSATEDGFLAHVWRTRQIKPLISAVGSCCLVGVIWRGTLYVANLGDSRAVIGCLDRSNNLIAEQVTRDHNASREDVRQELRSLHPDDSHIVVLKHGVWRIKGIIQGIARRLVRAAMHEAARKREMRYKDLKKVEKGVRRFFHDDITVVVIFIDHEMLLGPNASIPALSVRGFIDAVGPSNFSVWDGINAGSSNMG